MCTIQFTDVPNIKAFSTFIYAIENLTYSEHEKMSLLERMRVAEFGPIIFHPSVHPHIKSSYEELSQQHRRLAFTVLDSSISDLVEMKYFIDEHGLLSRLVLEDFFRENNTVHITWKYKNLTVELIHNPLEKSIILNESNKKSWVYTPSKNFSTIDLVELYEKCTGINYDYDVETMIKFLKDLGVDQDIFDDDFKVNLSDIIL
jgi:hypothetical protein